jgi:flagellar basal body-associated protein FliL
MSEESNDGTWSGLVKTIVGTVGTIVTAGGAYLGSQMFGGGDEKAETAQPAAVSAPAPVINITTNNQQNANSAGGKTVIIKEKAAPAKPKAKTAKEELEEAPKW